MESGPAAYKHSDLGQVLLLLLRMSVAPVAALQGFGEEKVTSECPGHA